MNLAAAAEKPLFDCDVEEPNGHLFSSRKFCMRKIFVKIPAADESSRCRACVNFCKFNALAYIKDRLVVFDEVCHSCGGCILLCPEKALYEKEKIIGKIQKGVSGQVTVYTGMMNTGEASGVPIIKKLLNENRANEGMITLIDCPPGSACTVMESIKDADYCILIVEPTVFGVHNLNMVYELVSFFISLMGWLLTNVRRRKPGREFCEERGIRILCRIPFDNELGTMNSNAKIAARESENIKLCFHLCWKP